MSNINENELNRLAEIGSSDGTDTPSPRSIASTIAVTILYCTSTVWSVISAISTVSGASVEASVLFSCSGNSQQCG